jgi:hypothetical protein
VNVLDENIPLDQRDLLRAWGIRCRMIGHDIARVSIGDDNILAMLHQLKQPILFTRDEHFFKRSLCHPSYGLIWLDVAPDEAATFTRRLLQHPRFSTKARRMGLVLRAHHDGLQFWQWQHPALQRLRWIQG